MENNQSIITSSSRSERPLVSDRNCIDDLKQGIVLPKILTIKVERETNFGMTQDLSS
jgi:hypothetical protein